MRFSLEADLFEKLTSIPGKSNELQRQILNKHENNAGGISLLVESKRKRQGATVRERNLRRLESNERERLRMHGLNAAFEVRLIPTENFV